MAQRHHRVHTCCGQRHPSTHPRQTVSTLNAGMECRGEERETERQKHPHHQFHQCGGSVPRWCRLHPPAIYGGHAQCRDVLFFHSTHAPGHRFFGSLLRDFCCFSSGQSFKLHLLSCSLGPPLLELQPKFHLPRPACQHERPRQPRPVTGCDAGEFSSTLLPSSPRTSPAFSDRTPPS